MPVRARQPRFTALELSIVVVVLGVLAAIIVPQASTASPEDRRAELGRRLLDLRSQLALYKAQHDGRYPTDNGAATGSWDWAKMTGRTTADGKQADRTGSGVFGPYFTRPVLNPISDLADDRAAAVSGAPKSLVAGDLCPKPAGWVLDAAGQLFPLTCTGRRVYDERPSMLTTQAE
jgi:general secretion pathway protein G